jgi:hypothetical protein
VYGNADHASVTILRPYHTVLDLSLSLLVLKIPTYGRFVLPETSMPCLLGSCSSGLQSFSQLKSAVETPQATLEQKKLLGLCSTRLRSISHSSSDQAGGDMVSASTAVCDSRVCDDLRWQLHTASDGLREV